MKHLALLFLAGLFCITGCQPNDGYRYAEIETEMGKVKLRLFNSTPIHRDNFVKLVNENFYEDLLFHRIIEGFMIQGGDPDSKNAEPGKRLGNGGPGYTLEAEIGSLHFRGALAAARKPDQVNPEKKSSGSQFYIVTGNPVNTEMLQRQKKYTEEEIAIYEKEGGTPQLDGDYTVFGEVVEGMEVVDEISKAAKNGQNRPNSDIKMKIRMLN